MRFVEIDRKLIDEEGDLYSETKWWLDTDRPLPKEDQTEHQKFVAVQTYADKDPNNFIKHDRLFNLHTDQAEYYHVCEFCYGAYRHLQWSGGTRMTSWRERADADLKDHTEKKGWCEFCDPIFGNGGWAL